MLGSLQLDASQLSPARSLIERAAVNGRNKRGTGVPTSAGEVHVESWAVPDLIHNKLGLEDGDLMSIAGFEKCVRDACQSRLVHEQDRATLGVELPLALEDGFLSTRCVSVSLMRTDRRREGSMPELTFQCCPWNPPAVLRTRESDKGRHRVNG